MSYDKLTDDVLKQIANGNGHVYNHEGKAMARELLEFRAERAAFGQTPLPPTPTPAQSTPNPWNGIP
jgi:hypothetical protein